MDKGARSYQASRMTKGNLIFPDRLRIEHDHVVFVKRSWLSSEEESIPLEQVASVSVQRGLIFADLLFETTGGSEPIFLNGLWGAEAEDVRAQLRHRMRDGEADREGRMIKLLERQTELLERIAAALERRA